MWTAENERYTLIIQHDDFFPNPRRDGENFGTMTCFHRRYNLGDEHQYASSDDLIEELCIKAAGGGERGRQKYEAIMDKYDVSPHTTEQILKMNRELMKVIEQDYVVLPVYLYDHSGLTMSTTDFHDPWDSGQVGIIYVSNGKIKEEFQIDTVTPDIRAGAEQMLKDEVATYDAYLRGECYCFELYENGELVHSCGGFTGAFDKAVKDMIDYLPDDCAGMVDDLAETDSMPSMVQTFRKHANILVDQAAKDHERQPRQKALDPVLS